MLAEPFEVLDRKIADAARLVRAARAALATEEDPTEVANPLGRLRSISSLDVLREIGDSGALEIAGLRRWVAALTLERALWPDVVREEAMRRAITVQIDLSGGELMSPAAAFARVLVDGREANGRMGDTQPARRRVVAAALARGVDGVRAAARLAAERRTEAARRLGLDLESFEIPLERGEPITSVTEGVLRATAAAVPEDVPTWSDALDVLLARDAGEGWPAHLTARWLLTPFAGTGLIDGLRLAPVRLPQLLGASSFARAFAAFGGAFFDATRPAEAPFVVVASPFDLHRARRAALFAWLTADPVFHARFLGLGRGRAGDQARIVARALGLSLRLDAARVRLRGALEKKPGASASAWEEETARALGVPVPGSLAGVVPRVDPAVATRLLGAILALRDHRSLVERFDEDWFRSPHAAHALREEDALVGLAPEGAPTAKKADVDAALLDVEAFVSR